MLLTCIQQWPTKLPHGARPNQASPLPVMECHPNKEGHWLIAQQIIAWFGDSQAAAAKDATQMATLAKAPEKLPTLVAQRSKLLHDAYVAKAGHKRPGVAKGLPLEEAEVKAADLTKQIQALLMAEK